MARRGRSKRKPLGPGARKMLTARVPVAVFDALDAEAERLGVDRTALLVETLAAKFGLPNPLSIPETLPLHDAA
jgi:hypothetical protein